MNSSFWLWIGGALAIAVGVLLVLGVSPVGSDEGVVVSEEPVPSTTAYKTTAYWEPMGEPAQAVPILPVDRCPYAPHSGCARCAPSSTAAWAAPMCGKTGAEPRYLVGGCSPSRAPCAETHCASVVCPRCGPCDPCPPVRWERPRINRSLDLCVDECALIQLHTTVPYPVSDCYSFYWTATKGTFLDPTATHPVYFSPGTRLPCGEDVWITLTVVDPQNARFTDEIRLHVGNTR
jgi:hypothetical protein